MAINIDYLELDNVPTIKNALNDYIEVIKKNIITEKSISNSNNVIEKAELKDTLSSIINKENEMINSYIDNILVTFKNAITDYYIFKVTKNDKDVENEV